jgi:hypothetical protein
MTCASFDRQYRAGQSIRDVTGSAEDRVTRQEFETQEMRSKRKADEYRRKERIKTERRDRVREILTLLGLWSRLEKTEYRSLFLNRHNPQVESKLAECIPPSRETSGLLRDMTKTTSMSTFECPALGGKFSIADYFEFVFPLIELLNRVASEDPEIESFVKDGHEQIRVLTSDDTANYALSELFLELENTLVKCGRINQSLYYLDCDTGRHSNGKCFVKYVVHRKSARALNLTKESGTRKAFWCGRPSGPGFIDWVEWSSSMLGLQDEERTYPVYVQSHTLENLCGRNCRLPNIAGGEAVLHDWLWYSLKNPKLTPMIRSPGKFLVTYFLYGHKLGYLVARRLECVVLIESFLFLTMDGTPEGSALWAELQLCRRDKEHLDLDKFETFLTTDIQFDPELVAIFEKCGCGHLFRLLKDPRQYPIRPGYAQELRRYLGRDD